MRFRHLTSALAGSKQSWFEAEIEGVVVVTTSIRPVSADYNEDLKYHTGWYGKGDDYVIDSISLQPTDAVYNPDLSYHTGWYSKNSADLVGTVSMRPTAADYNPDLKFHTGWYGKNDYVIDSISFQPELMVNFPPIISNVETSYTLSEGEDTVITAVGTDPEGDSITWSFEELRGGGYVVVSSPTDDDDGSNSGSVYVYNANNLSAAPTKLTAYDADANDGFGRAVLVTHDRIFIGANGDKTDSGQVYGGAVYVYDTNNLSAQPIKLAPSDRVERSFFGSRIAVNSNKLVIGARDGYNTSSNQGYKGAIYVYDLNDLSADPIKIVEGTRGNQHKFGEYMSLNENYLAVGVPSRDVPTTDVGIVYLYDINDLSVAPTEIHPTNLLSYDQFGNDVELTSSKLFVGAKGDDELGNGTGAVYVYDLNDLSAEPTKLTAFDGSTPPVSHGADTFGEFISANDDKVVISAHRKTIDGLVYQGAAYVYDLNDLSAQATQLLVGDDGDTEFEFFGSDVAITDDHVIIGAYDDGGQKGSTFVYDINDLSAEPTKLTAFDGAYQDRFGTKVAANTAPANTATVTQSGNVFTITPGNADANFHLRITATDSEGNVSIVKPEINYTQPVPVVTNTSVAKVIVSEGYKVYQNDQKIYTMDINGSNLIELAAPADLVQPTNSRYGDNIAISGTNLVVIDPHGNKAYVYDLTTRDEPTSFSIAGSINAGALGNFILEGNRLFVLEDMYQNNGPSPILVYNITNGNLEATISASDGAGFTHFDVGNGKIAAVAWSTTGKIYTYNVDDTDGSSEVIISAPANTGNDYLVNVAVGNGKIVYSNGQTNSSFYIYDLDGTNQRTVNIAGTLMGSYWGTNYGIPNDKHVGAYTMSVGNDRIAVSVNQPGTVVLCDLDGSNMVALDLYTHFSADDRGNSASGVGYDNHVLKISDNKLYIAADGDDGRVFTADLDGSNLTRIATGPREEYSFGTDIAVYDPSGLTKFVNLAPTVSGIDVAYTLTQGQDTVITASATDPEGDAITWSFEELTTAPSQIMITKYNDSVRVYDESDLTTYTSLNKNTALSYVSTFGVNSVHAFGVDTVTTDDKLFVSAEVWYGSSNSRGNVIFVYDRNDLSATPQVIEAPTTNRKSEVGVLWSHYFGWTMSVNGDTLFVGARDWGTNNVGRIFTYDLNDLSAAPGQIVAPTSHSNTNLNFGHSLFVNDEYIVVGSTPHQWNGPTNTDGDGKVWVFDRTTFAQVAELICPDPGYYYSSGAGSDEFGTRKDQLTIINNKLVIGASRVSNEAVRGGAAYVYDTTDFSAAPTKLTVPNLENYDAVGHSVASGEGKILICATGQDTSSAEQNTGSIYVYNADTLAYERELTNPNPADASLTFGHLMSVSEGKLLAGTLSVCKIYIYNLNDLDSGYTDLIDGLGSDATEFIGSFAPSGLNGTTITQSDNVFTVSPGTADANFTLRITATDSEGNAKSVTSTFAYDFVNQAPSVAGIDAAYTLTQGQDTVITGTATDPEGDAITWSFEEATSGSYALADYAHDASNGTQNVGRVYLYDADGSNERIIESPVQSANYKFAESVFVTEDKVVVGAPEDTENGFRSGAVWVYDHDGSNQVKITASDGAQADSFGRYLSAGDGKIAVGAPDEDYNGMLSTGAVYIYDIDGSNEIKIVAFDTHQGQEFGSRVVVAHGKVYISATKDNEKGNETGAVYIYNLDGSFDKKLLPGVSSGSNLHFGEGLAVSNTHILISKRSLSGDSLDDEGRVQVFDLDGNYLFRLDNPTPENSDYFGYSVAANEDKFVIGSIEANGNTGSVYIYDTDGTNEIKVNPAGLAANAQFGRAVSIVGNRIIASSYGGVFSFALDGSDIQEITPAGLPDFTNITLSSFNSASQLNGVTVAQSDNVFTVTPGMQDANFTLKFNATDTEGNVTSVSSDFTLDYVNQAPSVAGIESAYTLTQGQDTVITAAATDPEGDAITWSFEEIMVSSGGYVAVTNNGDDDTGTNTGSVYIYNTNDLSAQPVQLTSTEVDDNGRMGETDVVFGAGKVIVGARRDSGHDGAVYIYDLSDLSATPTRLTGPANTEARFGKSVAVHSTNLIVGAEWDPAGGTRAGKAYVYDLNDLSASPTTIVPSDSREYGYFGGSVTVSGDLLFIGSPYGGANQSGAVYVYNANDFSLIKKLTSPQAASGDDFGGGTEDSNAVSVSGNNLIVGSQGRNSQKGAVYVFTLDNLNATPTELTAYDGSSGDYFGGSVASTSEYIIVGANGHDVNTTNDGAIYIYDINDLSAQPTKIDGPETTQYAGFGRSVSATEDQIFVGSPNYDTYVYSTSDLSLIQTLPKPADVVSNDGFSKVVVAHTLPITSALNGTTVTQSDNAFTVTPGQQDATFTLAFKATDSAGNVTSTTSDFTLDYVNQAPAVSGIESAYTLTQGQDTVITADATDPEGDAITWSYAEVQNDINSYVFSDRATAIDFALPSPLGDTWTIETWVKYGSGNGEHDGFFTTATVVPNSDPSNNGIATASYGWTPIPGDGSSPAGTDIEQWVTAEDYSGLPRDTWVHVAISSDGTTARTFVDGILITSTPTVNIGSDTISLGRRWTDIDGSYLFMGSLADFRVVKDTAIYTSNFSVPTEPLTEVPGTVLFTARASTITDSSSNSASHTLLGSGVSASSDSPYPSSGDTGLVDTTVSQSDNVFTVTPGQQDATFTLAFKATDSAGNVTSVSSDFTLDYVNQAPSVAGIESAYTLTQGQDTVITASATDPEGDAITWSFEEIMSGGSQIVIGSFLKNNYSGSVFVYDNGDLSSSPTEIYPSDIASGDRFGQEIAATPSHMAVSNWIGNVYVYDQSDLSIAPTKLTSPEGNSNFGQEGLAINDTHLFVGQQAGGPDSNGVVYVYSLSDLSASPTELSQTGGENLGDGGDRFGSVVAADNQSLVVSAPYYDNGVGAQNIGRLYVYDVNNLSAAPTVVSNTAYQDNTEVGSRELMLTSEKIIAGSTEYEDENGIRKGAVFIHDRNNLDQAPVILVGHEQNGNFGLDAYANDDILVVGAPNENSSTGAAYVYDMSNLSTTPIKLTAYDSAVNDNFGWEVYVTHSNILIGSYVDDDGGNNSGAVYIYDRSDLSSQPAKLIGHAENAYFGNTFAGYSSNSTMNGTTVTQSDNVFTVTPGQQDATFTLAFKATDSEGNVTSTTSDFTLDYVNQAPSLSGIEPVYTLTQGVNEVIVPIVSDVEGETVTMSYEEVLGEGVPSGMNGTTVTQNGNDFTVTPGQQDANFTLRFTATDESGNQTHFDSEFTLDYNEAPTITGVDSSYTLDQGQDTQITVTTSDSDGDTVSLTYAVTSGDLSGTTVTQADNVFTITPGNQDATFQLTFTATDPNGAATSVSSDITFDYNAAPVITGIESVYTLTQGVDEVIVGMSSDADGDAVTWSFAEVLNEGVPSGLNGTTITQNGGEFTVTPGTANANFTIRFTLTDTAGNTDTRDADFSLTYVNQAPAVSGIDAAYTLTQGQDTVITADATDPEGDTITWSYETADHNSLLLLNASGALTEDASSNDHTVSVSGNVNIQSETPYTSGNSYYFDGSNDYMRCDPALDTLTNATDSFTIEAWIKPENMTNNLISTPFALNRASDGMNALVYSGTSSNSSHSTTYGSVHYYTGSAGNINQTITIPENTWSHVAVVFNGSTLTSYINGQESFSQAFTMAAAPADCVLLLGGEADAGNAGSMGNWYKGYIADFRVTADTVYTEAFTPTTEAFAVSGLGGTTVSQSDNVFTVTPGSEETSFQLTFKATDSEGNVTSTTPDFTVEAAPTPQMGDLFIGSDGYSTGDFNLESEVAAWTKTSNTSWLAHRSTEGGHMEMGWGTDNQVGAYIELDVVPNTEYTISFSGTATSGAGVGHVNYRDAYVNVRVVDSEPVGTNAAALILQTTPSTTGGTYPNGSTASNGWQPQTSKSGYQTLSGTITPHGSKLTIQILNVDLVVQYFDDFSVTGLVPV